MSHDLRQLGMTESLRPCLLYSTCSILRDDTARQIDALVHELYGLTDEDIRVVEGG